MIVGAAARSCSSADGGKRILSPGSLVEREDGATEYWAVHWRDAGCADIDAVTLKQERNEEGYVRIDADTLQTLCSSKASKREEREGWC